MKSLLYVEFNVWIGFDLSVAGDILNIPETNKFQNEAWNISSKIIIFFENYW